MQVALYSWRPRPSTVQTAGKLVLLSLATVKDIATEVVDRLFSIILIFTKIST